MCQELKAYQEYKAIIQAWRHEQSKIFLHLTSHQRKDTSHGKMNMWELKTWTTMITVSKSFKAFNSSNSATSFHKLWSKQEKILTNIIPVLDLQFGEMQSMRILSSTTPLPIYLQSWNPIVTILVLTSMTCRSIWHGNWPGGDKRQWHVVQHLEQARGAGCCISPGKQYVIDKLSNIYEETFFLLSRCFL